MQCSAVVTSCWPEGVTTRVEGEGASAPAVGQILPGFFSSLYKSLYLSFKASLTFSKIHVEVSIIQLQHKQTAIDVKV